MLEGYPCERINDLKVSWLQRQAEHAFPSMPVHLVPPSRECPDETAGAFGPVEVLLMTLLESPHSALRWRTVLLTMVPAFGVERHARGAGVRSDRTTQREDERRS